MDSQFGREVESTLFELWNAAKNHRRLSARSWLRLLTSHVNEPLTPQVGVTSGGQVSDRRNAKRQKLARMSARNVRKKKPSSCIVQPLGSCDQRIVTTLLRWI